MRILEKTISPPRTKAHLAGCILSLLWMMTGTACATGAGAGIGQATEQSTDTAGSDAGTAASSASNTVSTLKSLMERHQLTELRTTYNGTYGASLLFNPDNMTYYAALFQDKDFWRVIQTDSIENAESLYATFADQTKSLAQVYIDTVRLQAGKRYTEKLVAMNEARLRGLQQEVEQQRQQSMQVSTALQQAKQQAAGLGGDLRETNTQLDALYARIRELQAIQENPALSLPAVQQQPAPPAN